MEPQGSRPAHRRARERAQPDRRRRETRVGEGPGELPQRRPTGAARNREGDGQAVGRQRLLRVGGSARAHSAVAGLRPHDAARNLRRRRQRNRHHRRQLRHHTLPRESNPGGPGGTPVERVLQRCGDIRRAGEQRAVGRRHERCLSERPPQHELLSAHPSHGRVRGRFGQRPVGGGRRAETGRYGACVHRSRHRQGDGSAAGTGCGFRPGRPHHGTRPFSAHSARRCAADHRGL